MTKNRNYSREYARNQGSPLQIKARSERNKARRALGLQVGDRREVDHKRPLSKGGTNSGFNLRAVSRRANRSKGAR